VTPGAEAILTPRAMAEVLRRHHCGDYGEIEDEDVHQNQRSLSNCGMIMSVFHTATGVEFWVQTHGSRSHTLILLPGE